MNEPKKSGDLKQASVLLQVAKRDLTTLSSMLNSKSFAEESFGFFVQQAAEKLMKAWLTLLGKTYPYTHNLTFLIQNLEDLKCDMSDYWELTDFNAFAVQYRYELLISETDSIVREEAIAKIQTLYNHVETVFKSSKIKKGLSDTSEEE